MGGFDEDNLRDLDERGYTLVFDVLSEVEISNALRMFRDWEESLPDKEEWLAVNPHGIYKFHEAGHQEHAWYIRTLPNVQDSFKKIWNTDELVVSFDGCCHMPKEFSRKDRCWMHSDQGPRKIGRQCVQGMVALTSNKERTIVVYEGTHKLHEQYCKDRGLSQEEVGDWVVIDDEMRAMVYDRRRTLNIPAGTLVLWDSRLFHENQFGPVYENPDDAEERIVQYVCFLPKNHLGNSLSTQKRRRQYFEERRNTSHWPYPIIVVPRQPRTYDGLDSIDYSELKEPSLENYMDEIEKLL
jgi:hypothetical protein